MQDLTACVICGIGSIVAVSCAYLFSGHNGETLIIAIPAITGLITLYAGWLHGSKSKAS